LYQSPSSPLCVVDCAYFARNKMCLRFLSTERATASTNLEVTAMSSIVQFFSHSRFPCFASQHRLNVDAISLTHHVIHPHCIPGGLQTTTLPGQRRNKRSCRPRIRQPRAPTALPPPVGPRLPQTTPLPHLSTLQLVRHCYTTPLPPRRHLTLHLLSAVATSLLSRVSRYREDDLGHEAQPAISTRIRGYDNEWGREFRGAGAGYRCDRVMGNERVWRWECCCSYCFLVNLHTLSPLTFAGTDTFPHSSWALATPSAPPRSSSPSSKSPSAVYALTSSLSANLSIRHQSQGQPTSGASHPRQSSFTPLLKSVAALRTSSKKRKCPFQAATRLLLSRASGFSPCT
jgi:hypothetical protein